MESERLMNQRDSVILNWLSHIVNSLHILVIVKDTVCLRPVTLNLWLLTPVSVVPSGSIFNHIFAGYESGRLSGSPLIVPSSTEY